MQKMSENRRSQGVGVIFWLTLYCVVRMRICQVNITYLNLAIFFKLRVISSSKHLT